MNASRSIPAGRDISASSVRRSVLNEETFHWMISLERRRTERSGKPFLLMLLELGDKVAPDVLNLNKLLADLSASTRETDVAGWYKNDRVLGVMFLEIDCRDRESTLDTMIARIRNTLFTQLSSEQFNSIRVSFHIFPEDWQEENPKHLGSPELYPELSKSENAKRFAKGLKRTIDVIGSFTALVLTSPLFLLIASAIKVTSKGPVFFRQQRIGQYGKPFTFLKFRSMHVANDNSVHKNYVKALIAGSAERHPANTKGEGVFKLTNDQRITAVGAFLRRSSLDELPQFIHVLKGEMSLVGPRPPLPYEVEAYGVWHRRRLVEATPGITGLWQVSGRSRMRFDEMVRLDLQYARNWSLWLDIKILLRTPLVVILGDGAH
jgi:lipopolysaccharide/colanic/teichoic acid biosynthesis glycosyltransferase